MINFVVVSTIVFAIAFISYIICFGKLLISPWNKIHPAYRIAALIDLGLAVWGTFVIFGCK